MILNPVKISELIERIQAVKYNTPAPYIGFSYSIAITNEDRVLPLLLLSDP